MYACGERWRWAEFCSAAGRADNVGAHWISDRIPRYFSVLEEFLKE